MAQQGLFDDQTQTRTTRSRNKNARRNKRKANKRVGPGLVTAEEVRTIRKTMGATYRQLGGLLGVAPSTIMHWEKGTFPISPHHARLLRLLDTAPRKRLVSRDWIRILGTTAAVAAGMAAFLWVIQGSRGAKGQR